MPFKDSEYFKPILTVDLNELQSLRDLVAQTTAPMSRDLLERMEAALKDLSNQPKSDFASLQNEIPKTTLADSLVSSIYHHIESLDLSSSATDPKLQEVAERFVQNRKSEINDLDDKIAKDKERNVLLGLSIGEVNALHNDFSKAQASASSDLSDSFAHSASQMQLSLQAMAVKKQDKVAFTPTVILGMYDGIHQFLGSDPNHEKRDQYPALAGFVEARQAKIEALRQYSEDSKKHEKETREETYDDDEYADVDVGIVRRNSSDSEGFDDPFEDFPDDLPEPKSPSSADSDSSFDDDNLFDDIDSPSKSKNFTDSFNKVKSGLKQVKGTSETEADATDDLEEDWDRDDTHGLD